MKLQTLKGFRDFLPTQARKRQYVIDTLRGVFESYGFEPLETPALEYEEILLGKYGEEGDKLMYRFTDRGGRKVALRYDQTVPLARVVAQYQNELPMPFKRYQIQPVWRAENTQKGRFREFLQCDADIVGSSSTLSDAECIMAAANALVKLGFQRYKVFINDRTIFADLPNEAIIVIDKLKKIGRDGVIQELVERKVVKDKDEATSLLARIEGAKETELIKEIFDNLDDLGLGGTKYDFSPTLARGLDYYTSTIFEIEVDGYSAGSVCGGGRYDNLIGMFLGQKNLPAGRQVPAVGFSFGFDRIIEAMEELNLFPPNLTTAQVLVTVFSEQIKQRSIEVCSIIRMNGINCELYLDETAKMEKQLKYADQKGIPYVIVIGPDEVKNNTITLRNMKTREQKKMTTKDVILSLSEREDEGSPPRRI